MGFTHHQEASMFRNLQEISETELTKLVADGVPESIVLEYKFSLPSLRSDSDKREFTEDVTSFANTDGGYIVYGIAERPTVDGTNSGIAGSLNPQEANSVSSTITQMESILVDSVEPRLRVQFRSVQMQNGAILVCFIPRSSTRPHRVKTSRVFPGRVETRKFQMDITQIRTAFLGANESRKSIESFVADRLLSIRAGTTIAGFDAANSVISHFVPIDSFELDRPRHSVGELKGTTTMLNPLSERFDKEVINLDGILRKDTNSNVIESYLQIFRNGIVESGDTTAVMYTSNGIHSVSIEKTLQFHTRQMLNYYRELGSGPFLIFVSIFGCKEKPMDQDPYRPITHRIDRDHLQLTPVLTEDLSTLADEILHPLFDEIHNAGGKAHCTHFLDGVWSELSRR